MREGRCVFDLSVSGRPRVLEVVGGWEKTENKKRRGGRGPALRIRPRREKNSDLDHESLDSWVQNQNPKDGSSEVSWHVLEKPK